MPPRRFSRHAFTTAQKDGEGRLYLSDREPFRYQNLPDNRTHMVSEGETLFTLAARYFEGIERPAGLWWVIADFQPEPLHDPTISLKANQELVIPSIETVISLIFGEERREEAAG